MAFDTPLITNDQSIDRVLATGLPVVLVFLEGQPGAELKQAMDRIAAENAGKLLVAQIRPKDSPETARRYQINRLPAVVTIKNGQMLSRAEGIQAGDLYPQVNYLLGKGPKPEPAPAQSGPAPAGAAQRPAGRPAANGQARAVTDATFDQVVMHSPSPVLVDFWAPWCGPCRMTEPAIEKLSHELAGKMVVAKVNVDENPGVASRYGIQSIPTMMIVKNGQVVDRWVGALPEPALRSRVSALVK